MACAVVATALLTIIILLVTMMVCGYAPFGDHSIAVADARIQYLDFFGYLKRVFFGQDSILFSFSKGLGGGCLALFAYYLASPLNALIVFFQQFDLNTFFNLLLICKSTLASLTFALFLAYRFRKFLQPNSKHFAIKHLFIILLSCSYGLCQYMLAQASNIMWLDGVYMLPLLMLATYRIVQGRSSFPLAILCGLTILFNWYSAGIDCLFILIWFVMELSLKFVSRSTVPIKLYLRTNVKIIVRFIIALVIGVLLSSVLFIPTIAALFGTGHGTPSLTAALSPHFIGQIPTLFERYSIGAGSIYGAASVFCGSLALIGLIMLFYSRHIPRKTKVIFALLVAILILMLYWNPLVMIFSLFEHVGSYWYRYSYTVIAGILFLSAYYFLQHIHTSDYRKILAGSISVSLILIFVQYIHSAIELNLVYKTAVLLIGIALCLIAYLATKRKTLRTISLIGLTIISLTELTYETYVFLRGYNEVSSSAYRDYIISTQALLEQIQSHDLGIYRISPTSNQYSDEAGVLGATANYNESLSFGYLSLGTYTSTPDEQQLALLEKLGYRSDFEIRTIVNTSIIGTDSLLGVKYVLSEYPINGLTKLKDSLIDSTGRQIYKNPYALPLGIVYQSNNRTIKAANPFEYQNQFYSKLLNRDVKLYRPITYRYAYTTSPSYTLDIPAGNYAIYGNIPATGDNPDLILNVNNKYSIGYARSADATAATLVPSVFYIPTSGTQQNVAISLSSEQGQYHLGTPEFYYLDLDLLREVTQELLVNSQPEIQLSQTSATIHATANANQSLYLSLPASPEWKVYRNGELIQPETIADGLISVPLTEGSNCIELKYYAPGLKLGILLSMVGVVGVVILIWHDHKTKKNLVL